MTNMEDVIVHLSAECYRCGDNGSELRIPRQEWDSMNRLEKIQYLNESAETNAGYVFGYGWHIRNDEDRSAVSS